MGEPVWQAPGVQIYGDVRFGKGVSLWSNVVIRAESHYVEVGDFTNIQDFSMLHIGDGPTVIGAYCSITHHATVHAATIGDNCLIGINATIMDGAVIGDNCTIAGNSIVREGTFIADNSIAAGVPAKVITERNNYIPNKLNAVAYEKNGRAYAVGNYRLWSEQCHLDEMIELKEMLENES